MKNLLLRLYGKVENYSVVRFVVRHPYLVMSIVVVFYVCLFNQYNLYDFIKAKHTISKLDSELEYYVAKKTEDSLKLYNLKTDNENLIKFAREQYMMKANNEDVYVIKTK